MIIAAYDESDLFNEDTNEYEECDFYWDDFKDEIYSIFKTRKFPLQLEAVESNWRQQTGSAIVNDVDDLLSKIMSFGNTSIELHRGRGSRLWFRTNSHDCPLGFDINVNTIK